MFPAIRHMKATETLRAGNWSPGHSLSAPKVPSCREPPQTPSRSSHSSLSPGLSPSASVALNFPLRSKPGVFFSREISLIELRGLGHIGEVAEDEDSPHAKDLSSRLKEWMSKSAKLSYDSAATFHSEIREAKEKMHAETLALGNPPPGFTATIQNASPAKEGKKEKDWAEYSSGCNYTPSASIQFNWEIIPEKSPVKQQNPIPEPVVVPIVPCTSAVPPPVSEDSKQPVIQLRLPPKKVKRAQRGTFQAETVIENRARGSLKFYHLKKRFGFITVDEEGGDVFLCEDDIVLSNVNYKKFKEDVAGGVKPRFEFSIKVYEEKGQEKRKAINISCLSS